MDRRETYIFRLKLGYKLFLRNKKRVYTGIGLSLFILIVSFVIKGNLEVDYYNFIKFSIGDSILVSDFVERNREPYDEFPLLDKTHRHLIYNGFIVNFEKIDSTRFLLLSIDVTTPRVKFKNDSVFVGMSVKELHSAYIKYRKVENSLDNIIYFCNGAKLNFTIKDGLVHTINVSAKKEEKIEGKYINRVKH